jgi:predicted AAA+ superfamily ATPase
MLHLNDGRGDLSRRAMMYHLRGLSFREFLHLRHGQRFDKISLQELLQNHAEISKDVNNRIKPLAFFQEYLKSGYYPFAFENKNTYADRLREAVMYALEVDLVQLRNISVQHLGQLKKLLYILSRSVPYKPNMVKLAEQTGVARNTLSSYLLYLEEAELIRTIHAAGSAVSRFQKPEKIYLANPNLFYALAADRANDGAHRETFFLSQVSPVATVNAVEKGDFLLDERYVFEVGGRGKSFEQIANIPDSFLAVDDTEFGVGNRIPLWLFGFLT